MATEIEQITDHARAGLLKLNPEFWGKPTIAAFNWAFLSEVQELEDAIWSVIRKRLVENAGPPQLKILGRLVGQPNLGFVTETHRALIRTRARANRSQGRIKDLIEVANLVNPGGTSDWRLGGWATVNVSLDGAAGVSRVGARVALRFTKAAEEGVHLNICSYTNGFKFRRTGDTNSPVRSKFGRYSSPGLGNPLYSGRKV